jgi:hypothetical protein
MKITDQEKKKVYKILMYIAIMVLIILFGYIFFKLISKRQSMLSFPSNSFIDEFMAPIKY